MKTITLLLLLLLLAYRFSGTTNNDTVIFSISIAQYDSVAKVGLRECIEKSEYKFIMSEDAMLKPVVKYKEIDLKIISIPVFELNNQAKSYRCGDKVEHLINFKNDPGLQVVLLVNQNNNYVNYFGIMGSYLNKMKELDSLSKDTLSWGAYANPFWLDQGYAQKKLIRYKQKNLNALVFMIAGMEGYWVIKNEQLYKLVNGSEQNANSYFTRHYSEHLIHDIANNEFKIGYPYQVGCEDLKGNSSCDVTIKYILKDEN